MIEFLVHGNYPFCYYEIAEVIELFVFYKFLIPLSFIAEQHGIVRRAGALFERADHVAGSR